MNHYKEAKSFKIIFTEVVQILCWSIQTLQPGSQGEKLSCESTGGGWKSA